jgi:hypothetical protein
MEDWEERYSENRYAVLWKAKDEENRYSARSLQGAEEYYEYRCLLVGQIEFSRHATGRYTPASLCQMCLFCGQSGPEFLTPEMLRLTTILISLLLASAAISTELFRYRGAAKDGGTLEYVF